MNNAKLSLEFKAKGLPAIIGKLPKSVFNPFSKDSLVKVNCVKDCKVLPIIK
jgi:hypothetical protein